MLGDSILMLILLLTMPVLCSIARGRHRRHGCSYGQGLSSSSSSSSSYWVMPCQSRVWRIGSIGMGREGMGQGEHEQEGARARA